MFVFYSIVFAICGYLVIQIRLLLRLIDKLQNGKNEKQRPVKEKVMQTLRGRSTSIKTESKYSD